MEEEFDNIEQPSSGKSKSRAKGISEFLLVIRDRWLLSIALALPFSLGYVYVKFQDTEFFQSSDVDNENVNIYITGGSQGADYINENLPKALSKLTNINVKHQCGKNNITKVRELYKKYGVTAEIFDFYENPAEQILWSDFVISRAGALSLSEISSLQRGALMIPLPTAIDNHQFENAKSIVELGMGEIHLQNDSIEKLIRKIENIISNKSYVNWKKQRNKDHKYAAKVITENIYKFLNRNEKV